MRSGVIQFVSPFAFECETVALSAGPFGATKWNKKTLENADAFQVGFAFLHGGVGGAFCAVLAGVGLK